MSKDPADDIATALISGPTRADWRPMTPAVELALKGQPKAQQDFVNDALRRKREQNRV